MLVASSQTTLEGQDNVYAPDIHVGSDSNGRRCVGFAQSSGGRSFTEYEQNPVLCDVGAVDVKKVGGVYVMLWEGGDGTYWATSVTGICWVPRGLRPMIDMAR